MKNKHIHLNPPQLRSMIIRAPFEWSILGRGTGKSEGILAEKSVFLMSTLPRSRGVFIASTFTQLMMRTLPPILAGWERMGYIRDVHYVIGKRPDLEWRKRYNWQGPFKSVLDFEYVISWWNGSVIQLVSQDRKGSANGLTIDWIMGDEVKLLNRERLEEELFPANRGIIVDFKNNVHHHGMTFTTDMPKGSAGRWILDKEQLMDPNRIKAVVALETQKYELGLQLQKTKTKHYSQTILNKINEIDQMLNDIRRGMVFFQEASTLENIHALGVDYIREQMRNLPAFEFRTAILNQRPYKLEDGFYPSLNEEHHGYFAYDYHYTFEKHGYDFSLLSKLNNCQKDGDLVAGKPLHIAIDYNRRIWPIVTGQYLPGTINELRVLSAMHVLAPQSYADMLDVWHDYYKPHDSRVVYFWYDHTALGEVEEPIRDKIVRKLRKLGWIVIERYIGKTTDQEYRYVTTDEILVEIKYNWKVRYNRDNCANLLLSMYQSQAIEKTKGFGKDKSTERDKNFPAQESTHYSDANDTLVVGMIKSGLVIEDNQGFSNMVEVR